MATTIHTADLTPPRSAAVDRRCPDAGKTKGAQRS